MIGRWFIAIGVVAAVSGDNDDKCGYEIQKDCIFERAAARGADNKQVCINCAKTHETDLRKVCTKREQVEELCGGMKPVIGGYDCVQYFSLQPTEPGVLGSPEFTFNLTSPDRDGSPRFTHQFWFSTAANRDKFAADPWKYAPKNGGYCSWGLAEVAGQHNETLFRKDVLGPPANASNTWNIVNGSLYMNADPNVARRWFANVSALVHLTDAQWIRWYGKLEAGPFNTDCLQGHQHENPSKGKFCNCATHPQSMPPPVANLD